MANVITHQGIVENIDHSLVSVRIIRTSACASCSAGGYCSGSKEQVVEVNVPYAAYEIGDRVVVVGQTSMGMMAVLLAFVVPFLVLFFSLFICMHVSDGNELLSALISLGLLVPYYFVVWLNRAGLKKKFSFTIKSD
ncbi:MAG: SoxR reducing system RseC family protein [Spirochaetaceae bacterium]|jgi:sigma-E factor negative regulatory protein RseC|nr:SoxR reducing system RseC family protein [Spirochaetaceae bacterium]